MATVKGFKVGNQNMLYFDPNLAAEFNEEVSYNKGDYVINPDNGRLYVFTSDHAAGSWVGTDAAIITVGDAINNITIEVDDTLTEQGKAADAKTVGDEVDDLKSATSVLEPTATSEDVGKTLIVKTVSGGKVTEYEFGEAGGGSAETKEVAGIGEIVVSDAIAGNTEKIELSGYADLLFNTTDSAAYRAYGFNVCHNPTIVTKDEGNETISSNSFTLDLMEIKCIYGDGTVHADIKDELQINNSGVATLTQRIGMVTAAQIAALASDWKVGYTYNAGGNGSVTVHPSLLNSTYQLLPVDNDRAVNVRPGVISNVFPPYRNGYTSGAVDVTGANNLKISIDAAYIPASVTDKATFQTWFAENTDIKVYLPLITPIVTTLEGTYEVELDDGYTKLICSSSGTPMTLEYSYNLKLYVDSQDARLSARIDAIEPLYMQRYHVSSIISSLCVCGDSLSVGWGLNTNSDSPTDANISRKNYNISWPQQYARLTGTKVINIGGSGMTAENFWDNQFTIPGHPNGNFADMLDAVDECEVYVIGLGENFNSNTIGDTSDIGQTAAQCDSDTFYGAYAKTILTILEKYSTAKVLCLTIPRANATANQHIRAIVNAVNGAELIDLEQNYLSLFNREDVISQKTVLRNVHFYPIGLSLIAQTMEYVISDYLWQNNEDWRSFGIATE